MKKLLKKEELFFIAVTYTFSWIVWLPLLLNKQFDMNIPVLPFQFFLASFGPLVGAITTKMVFGGKQQLIEWLNISLSISNKKWILIAIFLPIIYFIVGYLLQYIMIGEVIDLTEFGLTSKLPGFNVIEVLLVWIFTFAIGEEMGWRAFLFPSISKHKVTLTASFLVTAVWALWHLPTFFFNPTYMEMGFGIIGWLISLSFGSVLLGYMFNKSGHSIIPILIWHAGFDLITASDISAAYLAPVASAIVIMQGVYISKYIYGKQYKTNN